MSESFLSRFEPIKFTREQEAILSLQKEMMDRSGEIFALYFDSLAGFESLSRHLDQWKADLAADLKSRLGIVVDEATWR